MDPATGCVLPVDLPGHAVSGKASAGHLVTFVDLICRSLVVIGSIFL